MANNFIPDYDVEISQLSPAEQRLLAGLVPLLNPAVEGALRLHGLGGAASRVPAALLWRLQPGVKSSDEAANSRPSGSLEMIHPGGEVRAVLSRPIVLGALKRMMSELAQGATQPRIAAPRMVLDKPNASMATATTKPRPVVPDLAAAPQPKLLQSSRSAEKIEADLSAVPLSRDLTDPRAFTGSRNLVELLKVLRVDAPGLVDIRFPTGESIRVDRGNHSFRCRGFNRSELYQRLGSTPVQWAQLSDRVRPKTDETQASMAPLIFVLGVITAKERFLMGQPTELEFQISSSVGYARFADFARIAEAFKDYSPVADAALKLSVAPVEIIACLNGYAAIDLLKSRARNRAAPELPAEKPGLFSRIKAHFS